MDKDTAARLADYLAQAGLDEDQVAQALKIANGGTDVNPEMAADAAMRVRAYHRARGTTPPAKAMTPAQERAYLERFPNANRLRGG